MKKIYFFTLLISSFIGFSQNPGDIIITEILQNPAGSDGDGEYFELYNTSGASIDINGWTIRDADAGNPNVHVIENGGPLMVMPAAYVTLGRNGDIAANGNITHDYIYADFFLGNGSDEIILETPAAVVIDEVLYTGANPWPDPNGPTMQLDINFFNATDNDEGSNWCESSADYGTPGAANVACAPTCQTFLGGSEVSCNSTNPGSDDDTYDVTLDFNGAATGETFVVSTMPSGFTIGGDDPTSVADGTLTVSGVTEGTDLVITVSNVADGGLCELTWNITSPVCVPTGDIELELVGIIDFSVLEGGSSGKAIHVVATADIADLSVYGLGSANNGGGTDGQEYTFPSQAVSNGDHILLARDLAAMENFFTTAGYNLFDIILEDTEGDAANGNGNDAVELFKNGAVIETFGDIDDSNSSGNGWDFVDSWAYKNELGSAWPNGWIYGGADCTDFDTDNPPASWTTFDTPCVYPFVESLSSNQFEIDGLSIYPNPVNDGFVSITSNLDTSMQVQIFDVLGKNVLNSNVTNSRLNVSMLESGVYLVKVLSGNKSSTIKLVIR